ncbi:MAG: VWA domain-containing protein [Chloroflexi bacterium]|nr:VWA domain-containing protein [Chloroflexota bacterium]
MSSYKYYRWDGTQSPFGSDDEGLFDRLSEELMAHGDLRRALRSLYFRGPGSPDDERASGLRDMLEHLQQAKREKLQQYDLDSVMDDIRERLKDVVDTERSGIERRVEEAREQLATSPEQQDDLAGPMKILEGRATRNLDALDQLPENSAGAVKQLNDYEFMDPDAARKFKELMDMLRQRMAHDLFRGMKDQLENISPEQTQSLTEMLKALNQMLRDKAEGNTPDFDGFMDEFGGMFGDNPPNSLDELLQRLTQSMAALGSLMASMSDEQRRELLELTEAALGKEALQLLANLASQLARMMPIPANDYPFTGNDPLDLQQAMGLMDQLQDMGSLERSLQQTIRSGNLDDLDPEQVEELLGEDARNDLDAMKDIERQLEEAGIAKRDGERLQLTPAAIRKLAQKALKEVFADIKKDKAGGHEVRRKGVFGESEGVTKKLEFGDDLDINLYRTLFNSIMRQGPQVPIRMEVQDFEVDQTEHLSQAATALLLDQSRSMGMFGNWQAAKKVAMALYWLVKSAFPRDQLYIIGFSDYAVEITGDELPSSMWNAWVSGTNMHHALAMARELLSKHKVATRQILMITDGEPTAHIEEGQSYFSYPPSYRTIDETLREVKRCTRAGISINTFMLETTSFLMDFVDRMARINRGRAFYATADKLGRYVLVDYLNGRRKKVA